MPTLPSTNTLFYGDNLDVLRNHIPDASVDLVYLDPPFNSNRNYNILFKDEHGKAADAQIQAFEDSWYWTDETERTYHGLVMGGLTRVAQMMSAMRLFVGTNQMMAYLVMMAARLVELHRVLKPTGSLYLHCDSTASHYLKVILDTIFSPSNFRNEVVWKRTSSHNDARRKYADVNDILLFYSKTDTHTFNVQYTPHSEDYVRDFYRYVDESGRRYRLGDLSSPNPRPNLTYDYKGYKPPTMGWRVSRERMAELDEQGRLAFPKKPNGRIQYKRYLDEMPGNAVGSVWDDIRPVQSQAAERLGYQTQKPLTLLERIIAASSNEGDVILDPFCGCGTAVAAAQKLGRRWIGIDITHLAVALQRYRMEQMYPGLAFDVVGEPRDIRAAQHLAQHDRYQFQWWALSLVKARPLGGESGSRKGKKGADRGIDGLIPFMDDTSAKLKHALVQVKSGHVRAGDIRDLRGTMEREQAPLSGFITLEDPSREMRAEAAAAGYYRSPGWNRDYPRIQILTIAELLKGTPIQMPPPAEVFKAAQQMGHSADQQGLWG